MRKTDIKHRLVPLCLGAVLGMEILLATDALVVFLGKSISPLYACGGWALLTVGAAWLLRWNKKRLLTWVCAIPLILGILLGAGYACWHSFSSNAAYEFPDMGKQKIYGNRRVLVIVPHQDDELNILGGVLEEYVRYGSSLYPVYVTNGDYAELAETRYREALAVFQQLGVPEDQVIFLGYGNEWSKDGPHIYNAAPGVVMESHAGKTETYGAPFHGAYREGRSYTIDNLMEDLQHVILDVTPDVIFCSDYDHHIDHKAVSLLFEKVMGNVLKENPDYTPIVYKAYAYGTAWEAEADYYGDQVLSTKNLFEEPYGQRPAVYRWEDRIRFPVNGAALSRSLVGSEGYELLGQYHSQGAQRMAAALLNGDKVAWQRRTDSLCLGAAVTVSSGEGKYLNDFMLVENDDLTDESRMPYDGIWTPAATDEAREITVTLAAASRVDTVVLYDHPSPEHNVLNTQILFSDGTVVETGALDPGGAATRVPVEKENVSSFRIVLKETTGTDAGISEVEAFADPAQRDGSFLKLTDGEGNFLYDYWTAPDGNATLGLYCDGDLPAVSETDYVVSVDSERATAVLENGVIRVRCPVGETVTLQVACGAAQVSDSIVIRNPGGWTRFWTGLWQDVEETLYCRYSLGWQKRLLIPSTLEKVSYVLRHLG